MGMRSDMVKVFLIYGTKFVCNSLVWGILCSFNQLNSCQKYSGQTLCFISYFSVKMFKGSYLFFIHQNLLRDSVRDGRFFWASCLKMTKTTTKNWNPSQLTISGIELVGQHTIKQIAVFKVKLYCPSGATPDCSWWTILWEHFHHLALINQGVTESTSTK